MLIAVTVTFAGNIQSASDVMMS